MPKKKDQNNDNKRTEVSAIGKKSLLEQLFYNTGLENKKLEGIKLSDNKESIALNQKVLLEGIDFDLVYNPLKHLGYKSILSVLGDLYAKLYKPSQVSVNIAISKRFSVEDVNELWGGMLAAFKEHGIYRVSLDINSSVTGLTIGLSAIGVKDPALSQETESAGNYDLICLTGNVGAAYMGLLILNREKIAFSNTSDKAKEIKQPDLSGYKYVLQSFLSPQIDPAIIERFKENGIIPTSGSFVTMGLADSIKGLCKESGLGARIYLEKIPVSSKTIEVAEELNIDTVTAALNGGDDFRFIFTIPLEKNEQFRRDFQDYDIIGHMTSPGTGSVLVTPEGAELELKAQGWQD